MKLNLNRFFFLLYVYKQNGFYTAFNGLSIYTSFFLLKLIFALFKTTFSRQQYSWYIVIYYVNILKYFLYFNFSLRLNVSRKTINFMTFRNPNFRCVIVLSDNETPVFIPSNTPNNFNSRYLNRPWSQTLSRLGGSWFWRIHERNDSWIGTHRHRISTYLDGDRSKY